MTPFIQKILFNRVSFRCLKHRSEENVRKRKRRRRRKGKGRGKKKREEKRKHSLSFVFCFFFSLEHSLSFCGACIISVVDIQHTGDTLNKHNI